jgi:hypothetical protein
LAARRCAGRLLGGEPGQALIESADDLLVSLGVRVPPAFASVFAPWSCDDSDATTSSADRRPPHRPR